MPKNATALFPLRPPPDDTPDRKLLRAAERRTTVTRLLTVAVIVLAAIGGIGQLLSWTGALFGSAYEATHSTSALDNPGADDTARVTDFAANWVTTYLGAAQGQEAALTPFYSGAVELPKTPMDATDPQLFSVRAEPGPAANLQVWSVVVSVAQRQSTGSAKRSRVYYQVGISVVDNSRLRAITLPTIVPGPRPGLDVSLDYDTTVAKDDPAAVAIAGFLRALLAGGPDLSRYIARGYSAQPMTPPPFQAVTVTDIHAQAPSTKDGVTRVRMLATVAGTRSFSVVQMQYPMLLTESDRQWQVAGIEIFPALGSKASEPPPTQTTTAPAPGSASTYPTSAFGTP